MKGASDEDDILSFFSQHGLYFHHAKNQPRLSPPSNLSLHLSLFWPFSLCQHRLKIILLRIWVILFTKNAKLSVLGVTWVRNNRLLFYFFWTFKNPIGPLNLLCSVHCRQCALVPDIRRTLQAVCTTGSVHIRQCGPVPDIRSQWEPPAPCLPFPTVRTLVTTVALSFSVSTWTSIGIGEHYYTGWKT